MNAPAPHTEPRRITVKDAIYELCAAILAFTYAVDDDTARPYSEREDIARRLCRVMHALLTLTTRMSLLKVGKEFFAAMRQPPIRTPREPNPGDHPGHPGPGPTRPRPLSARGTARRIAALLRELDAVFYDYSLTCPAEVAVISHWLRTEAGCDTLPECRPFTPTKPPRPPSPKWPHPHKPGAWLAYEPEDWPPKHWPPKE